MPRQSNKDACLGFGTAYISDSESCIECKKASPARKKKCKAAVNKYLREMITDEDIEKWKKERKK